MDVEKEGGDYGIVCSKYNVLVNGNLHSLKHCKGSVFFSVLVIMDDCSPHQDLT